MLLLEQQYIIDCIRGNRKEALNKIKNGFSFDKLLELLCDHRLFLSLYPIIEFDVPDCYRSIYSKTYIYYLSKRLKLLTFQKKFINYLLSINLKFIVLKGFANEAIIYKNKLYRMFGDLDILMDASEIEILKQKLENSNFNVKIIEKFYDYYQHEIRIQIEENNELYIVEIKKRHREASFKLTKKFSKNAIMYHNDSIIMPILKNEFFFISSCLYLYNYIERIAGWLYSKKIRFCYFYDLYNFIINNNFKISMRLIRLFIRYKIIHKIMLILKHIYEIFLDEKIFKMYLILCKYCYNKYENDYIDKGRIYWNISILDRIFNYDEIANFIKKYISNNFYLGNKNYFLKEKYRYLNSSKLKLKYMVYTDDNSIYLSFKNMKYNYNDNLLIYVKLFCSDLYGISRFPYVPISIRICKGNIKIFNRFTVINSSYEYDNEMNMPYQNEETIKYNYEDNNLEVLINAKELNFNLKKEEVFGYVIEIGEIDNNEMYNILNRSSDINDRPLLIKIK